jgi:serine/threonine-protein kinase HipA
VLSPAYDLLSTLLHIDDSQLALHGGLYEGDYKEKTYETLSKYTRASFVAFAEMAGINPKLAKTVIDELIRGTPKATEMVELTFLSNDAKKKYIDISKIGSGTWKKDQINCLL